MHYQVSRNGQMYGPYTLEDLQRYLASGNVLPSDLAKSEEMADWVPVSQLLSTQGAAPAPEGAPVTQFGTSYADPAAFATPVYGDAPYAAPASNAALAASQYPDAPNLHWGLVLLFGVLTCYLFMPIWNLVVNSWLKRVQPNSQSLFYYIGAYVLMVINWAVGAFAAVSLIAHQTGSKYGPAFALRVTFGVAIWVLRLVARFMESASLEEHFNGPENIGLKLNPVLTFFFGGVYFQSQLNRINAMKQAARFGGGAPRAY